MGDMIKRRARGEKAVGRGDDGPATVELKKLLKKKVKRDPPPPKCPTNMSVEVTKREPKRVERMIRFTPPRKKKKKLNLGLENEGTGEAELTSREMLNEEGPFPLEKRI